MGQPAEPPPPKAPKPELADLDYLTGAAWCRFDLPLLEGPLNARSWVFSDPSQGGLRSRVITASALGDTVYMTTIAGGLLPPPHGLSYAAQPPDVKSTLGAPADQFDEFPVNFHTGKQPPAKIPTVLRCRPYERSPNM